MTKLALPLLLLALAACGAADTESASADAAPSSRSVIAEPDGGDGDVILRTAAKEDAAESEESAEESAARGTRAAGREQAERQYYTGPRGGCYTYSASGKKRYVDRSFCN